jgi:galactokinase
MNDFKKRAESRDEGSKPTKVVNRDPKATKQSNAHSSLGLAQKVQRPQTNFQPHSRAQNDISNSFSLIDGDLSNNDGVSASASIDVAHVIKSKDYTRTSKQKMFIAEIVCEGKSILVDADSIKNGKLSQF